MAFLPSTLLVLVLVLPQPVDPSKWVAPRPRLAPHPRRHDLRVRPHVVLAASPDCACLAAQVLAVP